LPPFLRVSTFWFFLISVHPRKSAVSFVFWFCFSISAILAILAILAISSELLASTIFPPGIRDARDEPFAVGAD
jgi:hypothetical protein